MAKLTMKEREYLRIADEMLAKDRKAQAGGGASSLTPAARTALETHVQVYPRQGSVEARQLAGNSLAYAQQSPKSAQEVALGLAAGNATRPSKGNISALDMNQLRQGTLDNETAMKILRDLGALNTTDNARNRETISMVGTDYLKEQATTSKALMAANSARDSIHMTGKRMTYPGTAAKKEKAAQWRDFYDLYGYEKEMPLEVMLRAEAIANGTGRTVRDFDLMDDETYDREYAALEEWYKGLDHFALTEDPKEIAYESETGKLAEMADMQSAELTRRETIERLTAMAMGNADYETLSQYTDTYEESTGAKRIFGNDAFVQGYDDQQRFMNLRPTYAQIQLASEYSGVVRGYANAGYDYLTDDELAVYNVLYNTDKDAAAEYLEALSPDLLRRRAQVQYNYNTVIGEDPFAGAAASLATILRSPVASLNTMYGGITGVEDPNASVYDLQRGNTAIRTAQAQLWGDMASFDVLGQPVGTTIYNTLMSLGDMGMAYLTGGALAGGNAAFAQQAMGFIMSSEAAAGTLHEDLQRGFTAEQALLHGITNGAVEYLSEQIPLGELFSNEGKLAWRILKTGLSEGGEEIFSGTVQIGTDALFSYMSGRESEVETVYKEYAKTMSHEDAVRATLSHYAEEVALQGVTGFFSGGAMGTAAHTANDMQVRSYGKSVMAEGDVDAMLNIAGGMRSDSQSAEWARRLTEKKNKGKKISTYDVGRLTMAMESDLSAELAEAPNMVMDKAIEERLVELGEDSANAAKLAPVIRKMYRGQKINPAARMSVRWDNNAEQVVKELSRDVAEEDMGRAGTEWAAGAKTNAAMATFEGTTRLFELGKAKGTIKETVPQEGAKAEAPETVEAAASAAVEKSAAKVKVSKGTKVPSGKVRAVMFDADGSTVEGTSARFTEEGGKLKMTVDTADGTKTIPVESVQSTEDAGLAAVAQYVEDSNNNADGTHQMSAEEANAMMHVYEVEGGDAAKFISNFEKAYLDGYTGANMAPNDLSENAAKLAYDLGKKEAEAYETKRVQRTQEAKAASRGTVAWLGTVTTNEQASGRGSEEALAEAMEGMSESQRSTVEVVQAFAQEFKTNVVLFESDAENIGRIRNGSFDAATNTIYIDVNSGAYSAQDIQQQREQGTLGYAIMRTMGHELTHYLEYNSAEGYAKYKQAVKTALGNAGQDWASLVRSKIDVARRDGRKLTYAAAEAEVVADASEYMLQDSKFVAQIDNSVKGKIKRFIQNFMQKLQNAFRHLTEGHRESIALRELVDGVYHYTGDLQQLWDAAMEETMVVEIQNDVVDTLYETGEIYSDTVRNSIRVRDEETIAFLDNQQHITTYRAMQVIDGKLYPPMAEFIGSKKGGNREDPGILGQWEMAAEHPELIKWVDGKPKFELKKTNDDGSVSTVPAAYNPYMHSSNTVLNDQFSKAFQRNNLVVVECVVPASESDGAYRAQYAKDATGWHEWKAGVVAGDLAKQKRGFRRDVFLSRYIKPVRILKDNEVAENIAGYLEGTDVTVPFQSAWPTLRDALVQAGVKITEPRGLGPSQMKIAMEAFEKWKRRNDAPPTKEADRDTEHMPERFNTESPDIRYSTRDQTDTESFKRWFGNSQVVNADGTPKIVYHQTGAKFTVFNTDNPLAGLNDSETPNGMFFKDNDHDIGLGGQYQMAVYLKADNILHFANRHEANDWYQKNVPGYAEIQKKLDRALAEFEPRFQAIEDEQFDPNTSDERVDELFEIEDNLIKELGKVETKYRSQLRELLNNHFLHGGSGYDAIELDYDGHRWVNGVRENVHTYIVFSPTQIKSATDNVGTFAQNNPDIRYSTRDLAGAIDIRDYLGNMKERPSMTETEKILLKRYQRTLGQLAEAEKKVAEQETLLRTATGDEITKTKNRIKIYRGQADRISRELLAMESDTGFARLMATSQEVLNRYLLGSAGNVADAADALDEEVKGLTKQLKAVEADVTRTSQAQRTAFARGLFDQQTLNRAAQKLKDAYGSRMSVKAIADRLALVYGEIYADNGAEGAKRFAEAAKELAYDILQGHKYRYKSETLPMLAEKIGTISLTETDVQEIKNAGMTISEYKKALAPWVKIAEGASDLSSVASNAMYYGDGALAAILGDDTEGNLAMNLYNYIQQEKAREKEIGVEGMSEGEMITAVMADIAGSDLPLSTNSKTAEYLRNEMKKYAGESAVAAQNIEQMIINAQKATTKASEVWRAAVKEVETAKKAVEYYRALDEHRRVMELREQKQIITEELKSDTAKKLQEKVKAQREEYRAREQKAREYRHAREDVEKLRRKVGRDIKRLNTMRVRETDKKHVPQEFQALADAIMRTFTDSELSRLAFSAEKTASLQRTYRILGEMESDFTYYWDDEVQSDIDNLVSLSEAYSALKKRGPGVPSYLSLEGVELEVEILQGVDNIVSNALNMIDMANRKFLASRKETFEAYANRTGENLVGREDHKVRKGALGKWQTILDESIRTGNMTPVYFFEHLQNPEIKAVFDEIRKGQSEYAKIIAEGKAYVQEMQVKHNYGKWVSDGKLKMKTGQGHTIELTREEAAELYALYKREQANKLYQTEHLLKGGFQYRNIAEKVSEDGKTRAKDNPHQLDAADMARISEWLTEEQKAYADALVGFLSTTMADYGNAASMSMYGYKKFTESYYIPFKTVAAQRMQKGDEGAKGADAGTGRLRNAGFTNKVQAKANATLYIGGITETVADHIHKMAAYSAMVQPIEDLKRLLNHKVVEGDGAINTIRALIGQKYGQAAEDYISQLLKDLNGATQSDNRASAFTDKMISAFKRGAVMASASVVLQQPTAMARAMAYISPKYFAQNPFFRPSKSVWTEMMQYAGDAVIKDMGKFDIGMGLSATQYIMDEKLGVFETYRRLKADSKTKAGKAAFDRLIDRLTAAPGKADQWTWSIIWKAVKAEQAAAYPGMDTASEAFLQKCGERFNDVIDHTQVYDSVLTKSNLMRSSNQLHKMATSFMSEPVLSLNMLYDAVMGKHGKKMGARIIGSVVASQVLAGAMAALVQAWNDDEDKRNWLEKYADRATGNILSNINILGMIPYISDIVSLFEGYDVERPDMSAIADIIDYTKTFMKSFENGGPTWKQVENFAGTWANLLGIPAKNISREVRRTRNMIWNTDWSAPNMSNVGYVMMENLPGYSDKNTVYYDRIVAAELRGDEEEAEDLRTYMLTSKMVAEDKLTSGLKTAMKDRYIDGDVDDDTAIAYLQKVGAEETEDDAYWEVDKWKYARETGNSTANYRKYDDFFEAVESGTNLKATVQVYLDNGVSKTTLASQITSKYKPVLVELWKAGKKGEFADLQARILTAYEALGYDRAKKLKDIEAWLK